MKKIRILFLTFLLFGFMISTAFAVPVLYDWNVDVNGTINWAPAVYMSPAVGGNIASVSGFGMFAPAGATYGFEVPSAIGSMQVTYNPGAAGNYSITGYFDVEIDEWINGFGNESGAVNGSSPAGVTASIENPLGITGDIAWRFGWGFTLAADQYAVVTFSLTDALPTGFYLSQTDDETGESIYLASSLRIQGGEVPVPEPATMLLLGTGLIGLVGLGRKRFKK